jgi:hypothetical protein
MADSEENKDRGDDITRTMDENIRKGMTGDEMCRSLQAKGYSTDTKFRFFLKEEHRDLATLVLPPRLLDDDNELMKNARETFVHNCNYCLHPIIPGKTLWCGACKQVPYCSSDCQNDDWRSPRGSKHDVLCDGFYKHDETRPGIFGKTLFRFFIDSVVGGGVFTTRPFKEGDVVCICRPANMTDEEFKYEKRKAELINERQSFVQNKLSKKEKIREDDMPDHLKEESILTCKKRSAGQMLGEGMFDEKVRVLKILNSPEPSNNVLSKAKEADNEAPILSLQLAFFNHACDSNCYASYVDDKGIIFVYAKRDIAAGSHLTIRYADPFLVHLKNMRKTKYNTILFERFKITCPESCLCQTDEYWEKYERITNLMLTLEESSNRIIEWYKKYHVMTGGKICTFDDFPTEDEKKKERERISKRLIDLLVLMKKHKAIVPKSAAIEMTSASVNMMTLLKGTEQEFAVIDKIFRCY